MEFDGNGQEGGGDGGIGVPQARRLHHDKQAVIIANRPKFVVVREKIRDGDGITELSDGGWYIGAGQTYLADTQAINNMKKRLRMANNLAA